MDGTVQKIEVNAPQQFVYETALDLETYPIWAGGVKAVTVVEEDEYGRPTVADFTIDAMIKEISYTLDYDHGHENGFTWAARPNDDLTLLEGSYAFNAIDNDATEVVYNTAAQTVQYLVAGNLNDAAPGKSSGVTGQAAYSASKDHILASASLRRHRSPYDPVFDASYLVKDGWDFADQQSRDLLRDAGFRVTVTGQELAAIIGLQETAISDQLYYQQILGFATAIANFDKTGKIA